MVPPVTVTVTGAHEAAVVGGNVQLVPVASTVPPAAVQSAAVIVTVVPVVPLIASLQVFVAGSYVRLSAMPLAVVMAAHAAAAFASGLPAEPMHVIPVVPYLIAAAVPQVPLLTLAALPVVMSCSDVVTS